jgi:hypothetical protein
MTDATPDTEARDNCIKILEELYKNKDRMQNIVVAASYADAPDKLAVAMSKHTPVNWFFSAIQWIQFTLQENMLTTPLWQTVQYLMQAIEALTDDEPDNVVSLDAEREKRTVN